MRSVFGMLVVFVVLCIVGVGFYRGWFALSSESHGPDNNQVEVTLKVDSDKVKEDAETVKDKTSDLASQVKDEAN